MDFQETGLLNHKQVYNAYALFNSYQDEMSEDVRQFVLDTATMLNKAGCKDEKPIVYALISMLSLDADFLKQRFGNWVLDMENQITDLRRQEYQNAHKAPEHVKLLVMADSIISMERKMKSGRRIECRPFENLIKGIRGKTSCQTLEKSFDESLNKLRNAQTGVYRPTAKQVGAARYPRFEDQKERGLPDAPEIRQAYKYITEEKSVSADDYNMALMTASVLVRFSAPLNPALIAAGLVDAAGVNRQEYLVSLQSKIGKEAVDILAYGSVRTPCDQANMRYCPHGFAQITLAYNYAKVSVLAEQWRTEMQEMKAAPDMPRRRAFNEKRAARCALAQAIWKQVSEGGEFSIVNKANMPDLLHHFHGNMRLFSDTDVRHSDKPAGKPPHPGV